MPKGFDFDTISIALAMRLAGTKLLINVSCARTADILDCDT